MPQVIRSPKLYDVCIIGSGAGGGMAAKILTEGGLNCALLEAGPKFLKTGGTMAVISFQSMEDRLVKQAFRSAEQTGRYELLTKKPVTPAEDELAQNPRSRSAKLRAIRKVS